MASNHTRKDIRSMMQNYAAGKATDAEKAFLETYYESFDRQPQQDGRTDEEKEVMEQLLEQRLLVYAEGNKTFIRRLWPRLAAAASVLIVLTAGIYFALRQVNKPQNTSSVLKNDALPGGNRAVLTLSNGQKIVLTNAANGQLASQGNMRVVKKADGTVSYEQNGQPVDAATLYNTITTPVAGQHEVTLSDGSEVMLDANSSITFPVAFSGKERKVTMTGQAYFTVHHNANQPFKVAVKGHIIEDLGTEFNINAYDDESGLKTTLVSGSVSVNNKVLLPGQQAVADHDNLVIKTADLEAVTAWKEGSFIFHNEELETTMQQLARWYNVRVVYEQMPKGLRIGGDISRNRKLSVVLKAIERTGRVKFRVEDQTIYVTR